MTASDISGAKTATLSVPATKARNGYQYRCKVSNGAGTVYSAAATLTVTSGADQKPVIKSVVTVPKTQVITGTQKVNDLIPNTGMITVNATGPSLSYEWQWRLKGQSGWYSCSSLPMIHFGDTTKEINLVPAENNNGYTYEFRCTVSNSNGSEISETVAIQIVAI